MAKSKRTTVPYRRRREQKTNYHTRLALLKSGKAKIAVRVSLMNVTIQATTFDPKGDKAVAGVSSKALTKLGWLAPRNNIPACYLTGLLFGKKLLEKGVKEAIIDYGIKKSTKESRMYAAVKGILDAGVNIPVSEEILPSEDRINGSHIATYAESLEKEKKEQFDKRYSGYLKNKLDPKTIQKHIEQVKAKI